MKKILTFIMVILFGLTFSSCCMLMPDHMSGSMHEGHNHSNAKVDPVTGKPVAEGNTFTYEYKEITYSFENEQTLAVFKNEPDHFIQKQDNEKRRKSWATAGMIGRAIAMTTMMVLMMVAIF